MKLQIAITSMVCMVVAMGMGRFALTPQLPHMIAEGQITLTQASLLAASNFLGYLLGAIETISARRHLILRLKSGLWGSAIILVLSALTPTSVAGIYVNLLLRFVAGIASAWTLVLISTWVQEQLGKDHSLRTIAFSGPGAGIILTGIIALGLDYCHASAALNWLVFGIVALIACLIINKNLPSSLPEGSNEERFPVTSDSHRLIISYALCGVAYVLPATFLSKLAVDRFPGFLVAGAFWPLFGFAVIAGMILLAAQRDIKNPQHWLAWIFCVQGMGVLACTLLHGLEGLLIGTLLVGGSFMVILQLTMRLGAELAPHHLRAITGVLTTGFAVGQLIGPLLSALSTHLWASMTPALLAAAAGSFLAALLVYSIHSPLIGGVKNE